MAAFNPYYVDEMVTQVEKKSNHPGLISNAAEATEEELHGYEVTMSGRLVLPELHPQPESGRKQEALGTAW